MTRRLISWLAALTLVAVPLTGSAPVDAAGSWYTVGGATLSSYRGQPRGEASTIVRLRRGSDTWRVQVRIRSPRPIEEITVGWTEFFGGRWSPVRQGTVPVRSDGRWQNLVFASKPEGWRAQASVAVTAPPGKSKIRFRILDRDST